MPIAALEGDCLRMLTEAPATIATEAATALTGRRQPVFSGYVGR